MRNTKHIAEDMKYAFARDNNKEGAELARVLIAAGYSFHTVAFLSGIDEEHLSATLDETEDDLCGPAEVC